MSETPESNKSNAGKVYVGGNISIGNDNVINVGQSDQVSQLSERGNLYQILMTHFDSEDLELLAFDFGINSDVVSERTKSRSVVARELIIYFERRDQLDELVAYIRKVRPRIAIDTGRNKSLPAEKVLSVNDSVNKIASLQRQGQQEFLSGNNFFALELFEQGLTLSRQIRDRLNEANLLSAIANVYRAQKDVAKAEAFLLQCLSIRQEIGDSKGISMSFRALGILVQQEGRLEEARSYFRNNLEQVRKLDDLLGEANALQDLGALLRFMGRDDAAQEYLARAESIWEQLNEPLSLALAQNESGLLWLVQGNLVEAQSKFEKALKSARVAVSPQDIAQILSNLALVTTQRSDWGSTKRLLQEAQKIYQSLRNSAGESTALASLAAAYVNSGDPTTALKLYQQSIELARRADNLAGVAAALSNIGSIQADLGRADDALLTYQQVLGYQRQLGDNDGTIRTQDKINAIYRQRDDTARPLNLLVSEAQRFFQTVGFKLNTTGELTSFLCEPNTPMWQARFKTPIFTAMRVGSAIDIKEIQSVYEATQKLARKVSFAFVLVDQIVGDGAWLQIGTYRALGLNVIPIPTSLLQESKLSGRPNAESMALAKHLEGFVAQGADPYSRSTPVTDVLSFFGREKLAQELKDELLLKPIGLFGLRKMGKSSLMRFMQRIMPCPTAWLDLQKGVELKSICDRILSGWQTDALNRLQIDLGLGGKTVNTNDPCTEFAALAQSTIAQLATKLSDARLAIFLDEIELLLPPSQATSAEVARYLTLMRTLRGMVQEDGNVLLMVAGVDPSVTRLSRLGNEQNPFFQFLNERYLPPLTTTDCIQMVRNLGLQVDLTYSDAAAAFVAQASGGHPYFARLLCSLAFNTRKRRTGEVSLAELQDAAGKFIHDPQYAANINENGLWGAEVGNAKIWGESLARSNQDVLLTLSKAENPQTKSALVSGDSNKSSEARALRETSVIALDQLTVLNDKNVDSEDPGYTISFGVLRDWIRRVRLGLSY